MSIARVPTLFKRFFDGRWPARYATGLAASTLIAAMALAAVWLPELAHWYVRPETITASIVHSSRMGPPRAVLDEIGAMQLRVAPIDPRDILATAESITRSSITISGFPPANLSFPFSPDDLARGSPTWALVVASLVSADVLLDAYKLTRQEQYFLQARQVILEFARFESSRWFDHGFLWNDHAIAARIQVLIKFWAEYRDRDDFDPATARAVLKLVARSGLLLAKPSHYAFRTGHGILQNLALLQIAAAFPSLPESARFRSVAVARLHGHWPYYIDNEGVTLLHSAEYHSSGIYFFGLGLRLFTLNGIEIPAPWWDKYEKAIEFYRLLRRPDGTLPMFGDTRSVPDEPSPPIAARDAAGRAGPLLPTKQWARRANHGFHPVGGHAIWWRGSTGDASTQARQTVVTWSHHPGHGHKHADELSMILWGMGQTWLTGPGYWPYGFRGRAEAESWDGANAPHIDGEPSRSDRVSRPLAFAIDGPMAFLDVERRGPSGYVARRQIVDLPDGIWIVIDHVEDQAARVTTTNWTFYPDLTVRPVATQDGFQLKAQAKEATLLGSFTGSKGFSAELVQASWSPFAGWVTMDRTPTAAPTVKVRQPSTNGWSLATFELRPGDGPPSPGSRMEEWRDANHWAVVLPGSAGRGPIAVRRDGDRLSVARTGGQSSHPDAEVRLGVQADTSAQLQQVRDAFHASSDSSQRLLPLMRYRIDATLALLILFACQESLLFAAWRRMPRAARNLRVASWLCWIVGAIWLSSVYLVAKP